MVRVQRATIELWMHEGGWLARTKRKSRTSRGDRETLTSWVLSKPPKCIHNSIVTRCTLTISFIRLTLFKNIFYWISPCFFLIHEVKSTFNCAKMFSQNLTKRHNKIFLDCGESVDVFSISDKQTTSNCSVNLTIKPTTNKLLSVKTFLKS